MPPFRHSNNTPPNEASGFEDTTSDLVLPKNGEHQIVDAADSAPKLFVCDDLLEIAQLWVFHDDKERKSKDARVVTLEKAQYYNEIGYGVFWTLQIYKGTKRLASDVTHVVCWYVDLDNGSKPEQLSRLQAAPITPSMIVESKNGYHGYWFAKDGTPDNFSAIVKDRLRPFFDSDKKATDPSRLLRVPGFNHLKDPTDPFMVRIVERNSNTYTESEMLSEFPDVGGTERREKQARQIVQVATRATKSDSDDFWVRAQSIDCHDALMVVSGTNAVNGEQYELVELRNGNANIYVDGKSTSCFVDAKGRIGSTDGGGPGIAQWIKWFNRRTYKDVYSLLLEHFPQLADKSFSGTQNRSDQREPVLPSPTTSPQTRSSAKTHQGRQEGARSSSGNAVDSAENALTDITLPAAAKEADDLLLRVIDNPDEAIMDALEDSKLMEQLALIKDKEAPVFESFCMKLRSKAKAKQRDIDALKRGVSGFKKKPNKASHTVSAAGSQRFATLRSELAKLIQTDWRLPPGYSLTHGKELGVFEISDTEDGRTIYKRISWSPCIITRRSKSLATGIEFLEVAWKTTGQWHKRLICRNSVADSRKLIDYSSYGLPVDSSNSRFFVPYLMAFEYYNNDVLPIGWTSPQLGWHKLQGKQAFLIGNELLTNEESPSLVFQAEDTGDEQIASSYTTQNGTLEDWKVAISPITAYWRIQVALYASLAAPLLEILKCENFLLCISGLTSGGKTTTLEIAASASGNPDQRDKLSNILTWDSTRVALERGSSTRNSLPTFLDDTKRAKNPKLLATVIYDFASGRERSRGSISGLSATKSFHGVMLSTGEEPLVSYTEDGGTRARILTLCGSPFERTDSATAKIVAHIRQGVRANYGHALRAFVKYLLKHEDKWVSWRKKWQGYSANYSEEAGPDVIAGRRGGHVAAIRLAAEIAHEVFGFDWTPDRAVEELWNSVISEGSATDLPLKALHQAVDWANANQKKFWAIDEASQTTETRLEPTQGWMGRWDVGGCPAFFSSPLRKYLTDLGHQPEGILKAWRARGWLDTTEEGRLTKKFRVGPAGAVSSLYALRKKALDSIITPGDTEEPPF